jgi:hypothetical protein
VLTGDEQTNRKSKNGDERKNALFRHRDMGRFQTTEANRLILDSSVAQQLGGSAAEPRLSKRKTVSCQTFRVCRNFRHRVPPSWLLIIALRSGEAEQIPCARKVKIMSIYICGKTRLHTTVLSDWVRIVALDRQLKMAGAAV